MTLDRSSVHAARVTPAAVLLAGLGGVQAGDHDAESVFSTVRTAVLDHRLPPGTQLKEQVLADVFGVSRAVIRGALVRLESARLAEHRANRGMFVATPSATEAKDIFAARRVIEAAVVEAMCAAPHAAAIASLRQLVEREQAAYRAGNARGGLRLSVEFHRLLARLAGNSVLSGFLEELLGRTPLVMLSFTTADAHACALDEHSGIVDAIERGDAATAVALMGCHIRHLEARVDGAALPPGKAGGV